MLVPRQALREFADDERQIAERLVNHGFVTEAPDRIDSWVEKIRTLRCRKDKLARIFLRFEPFDLPYDYSARKQVIELRDSLFESLAIRVNMSLVANKVQAAEEQGNLSLLELSDEERSALQAILRNRTAADDKYINTIAMSRLFMRILKNQYVAFIAAYKYLN
jgi:hypothetical protein